MYLIRPYCVTAADLDPGLKKRSQGAAARRSGLIDWQSASEQQLVVSCSQMGSTKNFRQAPFQFRSGIDAPEIGLGHAASILINVALQCRLFIDLKV